MQKNVVIVSASVLVLSLAGGYFIGQQQLWLGMAIILAANACFTGWLWRQAASPRQEAAAEQVLTLLEQGKLLETPDNIAGDAAVTKIFQQFTTVIKQFRSSITDILRLSHVVIDTAADSSALAESMLTANNAVAKGAMQQAQDTDDCLQAISALAAKLDNVSSAISVTETKISALNSLNNSSSKNVQDALVKSDETKQLFIHLTQTVSKLNESANNVNHIVGVMTGIANQTNLLSLNASIEAARAGEAGKGFAVVAGEVRKLSEQSFNSLQQIGEIISSIKQEIESTTSLIDSTAEKFNVQLASVYEVNTAFQQIDQNVKDAVEQQAIVKSSMTEVLSLKNNILDAVTSVAAIAEETAVTSEETTSMNMRLKQSGEVLLDLAAKLKATVEAANGEVSQYQTAVTAKSQTKIALVTVNPGNNQFNSALVENAKKAAKRFDFELIVAWPDKPTYEEQVKLLNQLAAQNIQGLILIPASDELAPLIDKFYEQGIVTVCIDSDVPKSKRIGYIGTDNYAAGRNMGKLIEKHLGGKGNVIISSHTDKWPNMKARLQGLTEYLAGKPGINIVATQIGFPDFDERARELEQVAAKHPEYDMIACINMVFAPVVDRLKQRINLTNKKILGFDNIQDNIKALEQKTLTAVLAQRQDLFGEVAVKYIFDHQEKRPIKAIEYLDTFEINQNNIRFVK